MARRKRKGFSDDFKAEAVRLCKLGDRTITQIAKDLDLTETALHAWVNAAEAIEAPSHVSTLTNSERDELHQLRRDVKRLQMERKILEKSFPNSRRCTGFGAVFSFRGT